MIVNKFEEQVKKYPDRIAVKTIDKELTYELLNSYSNTVAMEIVYKYNNSSASEEKRTIALLFEHGIDMIVGTIGALKADKIYVPFDPSYPEKRLLYMLEDSDTFLIVTNSKNYELALRLVNKAGTSINILNIDEINNSDPQKHIDRNAKEDSIAYILYTSGSTGNPKGVVQTNRNVLHFIKCYTDALHITKEDKMTLFSAFSHDAAIMDIYGALLNGATLYPLNIREQTVISDLAAWLQEEEITIWHSVPTLYRYFVNGLTAGEEFQKLRLIVLGGENVIQHDIAVSKNIFKNTVLVNLYGQTESSFNSAQFFSLNSESRRITLGAPVEETEFIVVDENREEVAPLQVGEIVVLSDYVALGYWKDEEKTKEVFEYNPEVGRLYWTGDLGRLLEDGSIEFVGRKGPQVKIRGFRVEIGEVESALLKYRGIREVVVLGKKDADECNSLCAYVVSDIKLDLEVLREYLLMSLPEYMVPSYFVQLEKMPLTPTGKLDRNSLPEVEDIINTRIGYEAPRNETEEKLVSIWGKILDIDKIGINDNFFELGGHSLKATALIGKIHKELNIEVSLKELFRVPTIKGISEYIGSIEKSTYIPIEAVQEREYYPVSPAQRRMFILNQLNPDSTSYNMPVAIKAEGRLNVKNIENAMCEMLRRHEVLRTSFHLIDGEIVQKIEKNVITDITYSDAEGRDADSLIKDFVRPFNLKVSPLLRLEVAALSENEYLLMFDIHHIISDGVSNGILVKEFLDLYQGNKLSDLKVQYKDYCIWENNLIKSDNMKKQEEYWLKVFEKEPSKLNMPLDFARSDRNTFEGSSIKFEIPKEIIAKVNETARKHGTTLNIALFAIYNLLLSQCSGQADITSGLIVAGRTHPDLEKVIGLFINFLPIRSSINTEDTFNEFLQAEKGVITSAYDNQDYPFDEIVAKVVKEYDNVRNPIYDSMFILHSQYYFDIELKADNLSFKNIEINKRTSKLDFQIDAYMDEHGNLKCSLEYNINLFKEETMKQFADNFGRLINKVINEPEIRLSEIKLFSGEALKAIERKRLNNNVKEGRLDLVVTSTFTDEPVGEYIEWWCKQFGEEISVKFAPYNQTFQQLLDTESLLGKNKGISLLLVRFEDWIRDIKTEDEKCSILERNFKDLISTLKSKTKENPYIIGIFPVSTHLMLSDKIINYIENMNASLKEVLNEMENTYFLDFTYADKLYGIKQVFDAVSDKVGHMPFTREYYAAMGTIIARKICALRKPSFKVIVADCDNTLWRGVCGEDGALGIRMEEAHKELQRFLIQKQDEGMLLALCSKNNEKDVMEVFEKNTEMILKKDHLASWKINWLDKSENIKQLAEKLNLGLDSFIFIDDNPVECSQVMVNCPEVLTLQLPQDNKMIPMYLRHVWAFDIEKVTKEDRLRTQMYASERERKSLFEKKLSLDSFLESLQLKVGMHLIEERNFARAAQLTQRTNQFNLSTIRRTEEDIRSLIKNENTVCWTIDVLDRFGAYGLVGLFIAEKGCETLFIDTFLLSCRALGRNVEEAILVGIKRYCENENITSVAAKYYPTAKNKPIKDFMEKGMWKKLGENQDCIEYQLKLEYVTESIEYIECYYDCIYDEAEEFAESSALEISSAYQPNDKQLAPESIADEEAINWEISIVNKENLIHLNHLLAVSNYSGEKLLKLPLHEQLEYDLQKKHGYQAPENPVEAKLIEIWSEILGIDKLGTNDNFFELGGHSLKATSLIAKIHRELNVEVPLKEIFNTPTIKGVAEYIKNAEGSIYAGIKNVEEREYYEMSSAQRRIYTLQQFDLNNTTYNMPGVLEIEGRLDIERLEGAFRKLIQRHEVLRTSFELIEESLVQRIHRKVEFAVEKYQAEEDEIEETIKGFIRAFDLSKAPLLRVGLIKVRQERYLLLFDMHHIISDGTSMGVLTKEFMKLYEGVELPELRLQYRDYALWQNELFRSDKIKRQEEYWLKVFAEEAPVLNLPTDYARPSIQSFEGDRINIELGEEVTERLRRVARETGATLYMVLLASFNILLSKYCGQEDIVVGSPIAGRPHTDLENIIGMFVNTLAMRNYPAGDKTVREFIGEVKENALRAYENQDYQFEELAEKLNIPRDMSRNPLFDVMFVLQNMEMGDMQIDGLSLRDYESSNMTAKFDMALEAVERENSINMSIGYSTRLFARETIERLSCHMENILKKVTTDLDTKLNEIEMLTEKEKQQLLTVFNDTKADYPKDKSLHQLFEEQVEKTPDNIAVVYENISLTYRQLNNKSNQLARMLRNKGVGVDSIVGIMVERSLEMMVGIMGILKAGAAYLPIDPEYPQNRIEYMLEDSGARILLTQKHLREKADYGREIIELDKEYIYEGEIDNLEISNKPTDLAYIIYTSGSTGKPKGVMIEHISVINYLYWSYDTYKQAGELNFPLYTSASFDLTVTAVFTPLLFGYKVVVYKEPDLERMIKENKVNILMLTPAHLELIKENNKDAHNIRIVTLGGEKVTNNAIEKTRKVLGNVEILNEYGPTETTVVTTSFVVNEQYANIPIGRPIANARAYILDRHNKLAPIGVPGELCIAGSGLARGYFNRPELTAEKFIDNPFEPGAKLYRTGDLARWLPDGNIEFMGRTDHQVKIRGFRIELGEIENQILRHKEIKEAIVIDRQREDGYKYLCAYIVSDRQLTVGEIRESLSESLPEYMIPSYFIVLESLPLTPNGKVDRKALPIPDSNINTGVEYEESRNEIEAKLAIVWSEVLGVEKVGIKDNFFELGGDSIKAIQVLSRMKRYGLALEAKDLFKNPTIEMVSRCVENLTIQADQGIVEGEIELSPIQRLFFEQNLTDMHHWNLAVMLYNQARFDKDILQRVFDKICIHHDILRAVYEEKEEGIRQFNRGIEAPAYSLEVFDFRNKEEYEKEITAICSSIQGSIDLKKGPLVKLGLLKTAEGDHLLIAIHHLIVDGVSWRILFEDLSEGYKKALKNEEIVFQEKTSSYREWTRSLKEYTQNWKLLEELEYWKQIELNEIKPLPKDFETDKNTREFVKAVTLSLDREETEKLLKDVNKAYNTEINDILLAALGLAIKAWSGEGKVCINVEGHGRECVSEDIDITRTIGWFTSQYPIVLDMTKSEGLSSAIKETKETLRRVPNKGIGYLILKYLTDPELKGNIELKLKPEINFNYLGQMDEDVSTDLFQVSDLSTGNRVSLNSEVLQAIDINGIIIDSKLNMIFSYNEKEYKECTIRYLTEEYIKKLQSIIAYCVSKQEVEFTPSDLGSEEITIQELEEYLSEIDLSDDSIS